MIDKSIPVPIYYQLQEHIKQLIESGQLQPGDMLPSEREYAKNYQISRMTVRQAITSLVNERLLYRIKGKGTFVTESKLEQNLQQLTSFTEDMKARNMRPSSRLISFTIIPADRKLAAMLAIKESEQVYEIKRVRLAEGMPMALERSYIPVDLVPGLSSEIVQHSLYQFIEEELQIKINGGSQVIEAAIANKEEVQQLHISENAPILLIQRYSRLENQTIVEFVKSSYRADRYTFMVDLQRA